MYTRSLFLGEAFIECSEEEANDYCEKQVEKLQSKIEDLENEKRDIEGRMAVRLCQFFFLTFSLMVRSSKRTFTSDLATQSTWKTNKKNAGA